MTGAWSCCPPSHHRRLSASFTLRNFPQNVCEMRLGADRGRESVNVCVWGGGSGARTTLPTTGGRYDSALGAVCTVASSWRIL